MAANGFDVSFEGDENVLELVFHNLVNIPKTTETYTLKE